MEELGAKIERLINAVERIDAHCLRLGLKIDCVADQLHHHLSQQNLPSVSPLVEEVCTPVIVHPIRSRDGFLSRPLDEEGDELSSSNTSATGIQSSFEGDNRMVSLIDAMGLIAASREEGPLLHAVSLSQREAELITNDPIDNGTFSPQQAKTTPVSSKSLLSRSASPVALSPVPFCSSQISQISLVSEGFVANHDLLDNIFPSHSFDQEGYPSQLETHRLQENILPSQPMINVPFASSSSSSSAQHNFTSPSLTEEFILYSSFSIQMDARIKPELLSVGSEAFREIFIDDKRSIHDFSCAQAFFLWYDRELFNATFRKSSNDKIYFFRYNKLVSYMKLFLPNGTILRRKPSTISWSDCSEAERMKWLLGLKQWRERLMELADEAGRKILQFVASHIDLTNNVNAVLKLETTEEKSLPRKRKRRLVSHTNVLDTNVASRSFQDIDMLNEQQTATALKKGVKVNAGTTARRLFTISLNSFPPAPGIIDECPSHFPHLMDVNEFHTVI